MNDPAHDDEMAIHQTEIYVAKHPQQAHLLQGALAREGIEAVVHNAPLQGAGGELPMGWSTAPRVLVARVDADRARAVAERFEQSAIRADATPKDDLGEPLSAAEPARPECPDCGKPRAAVCPFCRAAGSDFPAADMDFSMSVIETQCDCGGNCGPGAGGTDAEKLAEQAAPGADDAWLEMPTMLVCPDCDEPFPPKYYRQCTGCGHDFGSGAELPDPIHQEQLSTRVIAVIAFLVLSAIVAGVYLWAIL